MQLTILFLALMGMLVSALPAGIAAPDGRGATIHTSTNYQGASTAIPSNKWCTNLNNIFGDFDGKVQSITVEQGYFCQFFVDYACPADGLKLELKSGSVRPSLPVEFSKLHSALCVKA